MTSRRGKGSAPLRNRMIGDVSFGGSLGTRAASARPSLDSASKATAEPNIQLAVR